MRYLKEMTLSLLLIASVAWAGSTVIEPPAGPDSADSDMYTLEDIYNRLNNGRLDHCSKTDAEHLIWPVRDEPH